MEEEKKPTEVPKKRIFVNVMRINIPQSQGNKPTEVMVESPFMQDEAVCLKILALAQQAVINFQSKKPRILKPNLLH